MASGSSAPSGIWKVERSTFLSLSTSYDGSVTDLRVDLTRMFGEHWGIGAGWNQFNTNVKVDKTRFDGELDWRYSGGQIFVKAAF